MSLYNFYFTFHTKLELHPVLSDPIITNTREKAQNIWFFSKSLHLHSVQFQFSLWNFHFPPKLRQPSAIAIITHHVDVTNSSSQQSIIFKSKEHVFLHLTLWDLNLCFKFFVYGSKIWQLLSYCFDFLILVRRITMWWVHRNHSPTFQILQVVLSVHQLPTHSRHRQMLDQSPQKS